MISYALQGFARGVSSLVVSAGRQVILLLPLAALLGSIMGITGIWWSFLVAEVIDMILSLVFLGIIEKKELAALCYINVNSPHSSGDVRSPQP
jgi:Na+-driven multidrug efflux pump